MADPVLKHATKAQLLARIRERYKAATQQDALRLAKLLDTWIDAGYLTDAEGRAAFGGLTVTQWNNLKSRINTKAAQYDALLEAEGE